jgi:hypothetical protein
MNPYTFLRKTKYVVLFVLAFYSKNGYSQALIRANNSLDFDGNNDVVEVVVDSTLDVRSKKNFTLEAWIYTPYFNTEPKDGTIIAWYDVPNNKGYHLAAGGSGQIYFGIYNDTVDAELISSSSRLSASKWHHVAATYNGSKLRIYVDGLLRDSMQDTISVGAPNFIPFTIGGLSNSTQLWSGKIDEVRVWNYAKSGAQILSYYNQRFCGFDAGLRASYTFNQGKTAGSNGTIKKLIDFSGYGHDGLLKNFALNNAYSNWVAGCAINSSILSSIDTVIRCDRYGAPSKRTTFTSSGIYYDTIYSVRGCDSAIKIVLTIKKSTAKVLNVRACKSYTVPSGTRTLTASGVYSDVLINSVGCDSLITINLRLGPDSAWTKYTVCDQFITPLSKRTYSKSGIYRDTLKNYIGCDSVLFYDVTVLNSSKSKVRINFCGSVKIPTNGKLVKDPGIYFDTLINFLGCDSVIEYQILSEQSFSYFNDFACGSYVSARGFKYTKSGIYKDTLSNFRNCDSIITVDLTVFPTTYGSVELSGCRKVRSLSRKYWYYKSGIYSDTIMNVLGCDSVVSQNVIITELKDSIFRSNDTLFAEFDPMYQYQWFECGSGYKPILGANQYYYKPVANGMYACRVIQGNCSDTTDCVSFQYSAVNEIGASVVNVFPVPSKDRIINIQVESGLRIVNWNLYQMDGRLLVSGDVNSLTENSDLLQLNLNDLLNGVAKNIFSVDFGCWYLLEVRLSNGLNSYHKICY